MSEVYVVMVQHANGQWLVYDQAETLDAALEFAKQARRMQGRPVRLFIPAEEEETDG